MASQHKEMKWFVIDTQSNAEKKVTELFLWML